MKLKLNYREVDLGNFLFTGTLQEKELIIEKSQTITISHDIVHIRDAKGNTDEMFVFWESIEVLSGEPEKFLLNS